jgi:NADPH-dependent glutamate synthase beta subunit-like oxidoreductase
MPIFSKIAGTILYFHLETMSEQTAGKASRLTVLVIGAGPAGLVNARTLVQDNFDVTIVTQVGVVNGINDDRTVR